MSSAETVELADRLVVTLPPSPSGYSKHTENSVGSAEPVTYSVSMPTDARSATTSLPASSSPTLPIGTTGNSAPSSFAM